MHLIVPYLSFAGYLGLAVGQIWRYGADAVQVPQRLTLMLMDLAQVALPEHHGEIERWLGTVRATGERDPTWNTTVTSAIVLRERLIAERGWRRRCAVCPRRSAPTSGASVILGSTKPRRSPRRTGKSAHRGGSGETAGSVGSGSDGRRE